MVQKISHALHVSTCPDLIHTFQTLSIPCSIFYPTFPHCRTYHIMMFPLTFNRGYVTRVRDHFIVDYVCIPFHIMTRRPCNRRPVCYYGITGGNAVLSSCTQEQL